MFLINCQSCNKNCEILLDSKENKVYCSGCDKENTNVTVFVKNQLKSNKKFRTVKDSKESFAVTCPSCKVHNRPVLEKNKFSCRSCKTELLLTDSFKTILKEHLKNAE